MTDDGRNRCIDRIDLSDSNSGLGTSARNALAAEAMDHFRSQTERTRPDEVHCHIFEPPKAEQKLENSAQSLAEIAKGGMWNVRENEEAIKAILSEAQKHGDIEDLIERTNEKLKLVNPDLELSLYISSRTIGDFKFTHSLVVFEDHGNLTKIARPSVEIDTKTPVRRAPERFPPDFIGPTPLTLKIDEIAKKPS